MKMTSGNGYVALWMYLIPLNCILSNGQDGKFYVYWSQFKKWKNQLKMDCNLNCKTWNYKTITPNSLLLATHGKHHSTFCLYDFNQVDHISGFTQHLPVGDWFIALIIMSSGFIHVVAYVRISFFFKTEYSIVCINHILPIHSFMDTWFAYCKQAV